MTDNTSPTRYIVYLSFDRCDDIVRYLFVSHLSASLRRKGMIVYSKESRASIKNFEVFVVVISEKYLLSAECLNELKEIVSCQQDNKAVVVPVFYDIISPSEVVHRCKILEDLLRLGNYSTGQVFRWKSPLATDSYKPSSGNQYGDCRLLEEISRDLYEKVFPTKRIGIYSRLLEIENLLCKQPWGIRSIGIWGMPGIGKTTLAEAAFDQMSSDYEATCFIKDFDSAFREIGLYGLLKKHFGRTMEEFELNRAKPTQKSVLIVLDNVCKSLDAEGFLNGFNHFGPGSLIILTSRDKQVFVQCSINQIYEVRGLNEYEAKKLFLRCASREDWRKEILTPLGLNHLVEFSSGNPLAISVYGKMLSHKKPNEMETELLKLKENPPCQIKESFNRSYSTLNDKEKDMFLDIACFFNGEDADYVMQLFDGCGFFPHVGMYVLVEKCLVTISENKVQMHNLIQTIGREIANEETIQLRLWDPSIIQPFLKEEKSKPPLESQDVEDIEAMFFEISNSNFFVSSIAFKNMHNLRFLKIYSSNPGNHQGLLFHKPLESLPNELRLLHWENYPMQSLPQAFDPRHLVELNMPYSQLHKLWGGTKTLGMLKTVRLCHSQQLVDIDDLFKAQNIEVIDLQGCIRVQRFIPLDHLQHLRVVNLAGCVKVKTIPEVPPNIEELYLSETGIREIFTSNVTFSAQNKLHRSELVDQGSLKVLDLSGCLKLKSIQRFPRNLKELYLSETAIREVSPSITHLTALNVLDLTKCKRLQHLPIGMSNLTSLVKLMLYGCSELQSIQDFPRNLKELYLAGTAIKEVPASLCDLTELVVLDAGNCKRLRDLPTRMRNLNSLVTLTLSGCSNLEDIPDLPRSLEILNLAETPIRKLPSSFEDLTELVSLDLNHCRKLQHLRMSLLRSAVRVELFGCSKLEYILDFSGQNMGPLHIDETPCKATLILEDWTRFQLLPREMTGSKFVLSRMPFVTTPYRSKLPLSISSSLVSSMYVVVSLFLGYTYLLDMHIPEEICQLSPLETLDLRGNGFSKLPEGLKHIRNLKSLIVCHCPNLESLPELPQSLEILNAHSCLSLKNIYWSFEQLPRDYTFSNCFNLSPILVSEFLDKGLTSVAHMAREDRQKLIKAPVLRFSVPASVGLKSIFQMQKGSSVKIELTPRIEKLLGFRVSVVVACSNSLVSEAGFGIRCVCKWKTKSGLSRRLERVYDCLTLGEVSLKVRKDHMFVFSDVSMHPGGAQGSDPDILGDLLVFKFLPVNGLNRLLDDDSCTITQCGVDVISAIAKETIHDSRQPTTLAIDYQGEMVEKSNPLALEAFGEELRGKDEDHWEARLRTLTQVSNEKIGKVLRTCLDGLNEQQKDAFLDIAIFFRSQDEKYVRSLLDSFDHETSEVGKIFKELVDKFLIVVSNGRFEMSDLLFTMAMELVETSGGKYLLLPSDFSGSNTNALKNKKGNDKVRGIILDMSNMEEKPLDNQAFISMSSLLYLKVYYSLCPTHSKARCKLTLPDGIYFPKDNIIRYLDWMSFSWKKLPSEFEPTNLIDLRLPYSKIARVWDCDKVAPKLKWVDLSHSSELTSISSLSDAPNLLRLNLEGCTSLKELPEEMQKMKKLVTLNLRGCTSLLSLPNITMDSLKTLILSGCSKLQKFEVISKSLKTIYLNGTAIDELPPAIGNLHRLNFLNLKDCKYLASLPDCLGKLKSLQELKLSRCSKLEVFPDVKEIMESVRVLLLDGTPITEMPSSIIYLSSLQRISLSRNDKICTLNFDMGHMFHLKWLELKYCTNLTSLPRLPPNLQCLNAHGCTSLRALSSPIAPVMSTEQIHSTYIFTNCHELDQGSKNDIISYVEKKSESMSYDRYDQDFVFKALISTCFPGYDIPSWFNHQVVGSVLEMELPQDLNTCRLIGIALSVVVSFKEYKHQNNSTLQVKCFCEFTNASLSPESFVVGGWSEPGDEPHKVESDHVFIGYTTWFNIEKHHHFPSVSLRFEVTNGTSAVAECEVMKSGFSLVYEPEEAENTSWEATSSLEKRSSYMDDGYPSATPTPVDLKRFENFFNLFRKVQ